MMNGLLILCFLCIGSSREASAIAVEVFNRESLLVPVMECLDVSVFPEPVVLAAGTYFFLHDGNSRHSQPFNYHISVWFALLLSLGL